MLVHEKLETIDPRIIEGTPLAEYDLSLALMDGSTMERERRTRVRPFEMYLIDQIIEKSTQPHITEFEYEDMEGRFRDREAFREWWVDRRRLYALVTPKFGLAGVVWFGAKTSEHVAGADITFAIRLYEGFVGKGLAKPFMSATHNDVARIAPGHGLWLSANKRNSAAVHTYSSFGYDRVGYDGDLVYMRNDDALVW